VGGLEAV